MNMKRYTQKINGRIVIVLPRKNWHHPDGIEDSERWSIASSPEGTLVGGEAAERFAELEDMFEHIWNNGLQPKQEEDKRT